MNFYEYGNEISGQFPNSGMNHMRHGSNHMRLTHSEGMSLALQTGPSELAVTSSNDACLHKSM